MVHAVQRSGERHRFPALCQIFLVRCAGKTNICDGKLLAAPIARALGLSEGPRFQLGAGGTWTPKPGLFPGGWDSPGQARKEDRVSQRTCGHPGRQQQWRTRAAFTRMKSQFIFSSEIRWEETVTRGRNSREPGWGGGGTHFLIRALFMDVRVWLTLVHTGIFALSPGEKMQIMPFLKHTGARVLFRAGRPVCALQPW